MLEEVLRHLHNWFLLPDGLHTGEYSIDKGSIELPFLRAGQYFRIVGSVSNDGLYQYPPYGLEDETFSGTIWALAVPRAILDLSDEIGAWQAKNATVLDGPYQSESFGGYSYTKTTDPDNGGAVTWQSAFKRRLNQWRKI